MSTTLAATGVLAQIGGLPNYVLLLYILAFSLLIYGMSGLTDPRTAVRGNRIAAGGMGVALLATLLIPHIGNWGLIVLGVAIGTAVGIPAARQVKMTAMPQMVALFNGVGGGAVALIAWVDFRSSGGYIDDPKYVAVFSLIAAIIGSVSFWGSNIAFGKLQGIIPGRPITVGQGQQVLNGVLIAVPLACMGAILDDNHSAWLLAGVLVFAALLGNAVVLPIGGADMPVVISLLNAFTGLSTACTGVALGNTDLIVAGMIVGASGTILTNQMAVAMNRSIPAIVAGGFGGVSTAPGASADGVNLVARSTNASDVAIQLAYANRVVVVPGYGMAVAQAQHSVTELAKLLEDRGVEVEYAIHPVAGRMPGHMNVLLAEAGVPYEQLLELEAANERFKRTDVSLIIGANDVVNPDARKPSSPIYGMPILDVDESKSVIILKRSMSSGYAGIDNPLFYEPQSAMLFGDAKRSVDNLVAEVKAL
ncbi:MAG TPA: NAD(P)(+) transhydrogenase (Re/Si-specific) subunit beta [Acidimicrobiales bacterium]|nr:NAD(P)(+) transhydrogenase (Re/Si-specific) subunit beta [Acidimicrobiales bacterium]